MLRIGFNDYQMIEISEILWIFDLVIKEYWKVFWDKLVSCIILKT